MRVPFPLTLLAGLLLGALFVALAGIGQFAGQPRSIDWNQVAVYLRWAFIASIIVGFFPGLVVAYFCLKKLRWLGVVGAAIAAGFVAVAFPAAIVVLVFQSVNRTPLQWEDILGVGWYGTLGGAGGFVCWLTLRTTGALKAFLPNAPAPTDRQIWRQKAVFAAAPIASAVVLALPALITFK